MHVWILRRFGLLAVAPGCLRISWCTTFPLVVTSWYAAYSLTTPLLITAVAAWSLYAILTARPGNATRSAAEPLV